MASSGKSKFLGLSLWEETDRPERLDFRQDNEKLEEILSGHLYDSFIHLTQDQKRFVNDPFAIGMYTGNGEPIRTFSYPFPPKLLLIFAKRPKPPLAFKNGMALIYAAVGNPSYDGTAGLRMRQKEYDVFQQTEEEAENGFRCCLNELGMYYNVMILR